VPLEPVTRRSLPDAVYEQLLGGIVGGEYEPGEALPSERRLAEALGVSRPAVREALKRLAQGGLVAIRQGDATTVRDYLDSGGLDLLAGMLVLSDGSLDLTVARSIVEVRGLVGPHIARLAARRATPAQVEAIRAVVGEMAATDPDDTASLQRLALTFWDRLVQASDNLAFRLMFNSLRGTYEQLLEVTEVLVADEVTDVDAHRAIADAVAAGDSADAEAAASVALDRTTRAAIALIDHLRAASSSVGAGGGDDLAVGRD